MLAAAVLGANAARKDDRFKGATCLAATSSGNLCFGADEKEHHHVFMFSVRADGGAANCAVLAGPRSGQPCAATSCWRRCAKTPCAECEALSRTNAGFVDGPAASARFYGPSGLAAYRARDGRAYVLVADRYNSALRKVDVVTGATSTVLRGLGKLRAVAVSAIQPDHAWVAVYSGDDALVKQVDLQSRLVTREWPRGAVKYAYGIAAGAAGCVVLVCSETSLLQLDACGSTGAARRVGEARGCHAVGFLSSRAAITAEIDGTVGLASIGATSRLIRTASAAGVRGVHGLHVLNERRVLLATTWAGKYSVASVSSSGALVDTVRPLELSPASSSLPPPKPALLPTEGASLPLPKQCDPVSATDAARACRSVPGKPSMWTCLQRIALVGVSKAASSSLANHLAGFSPAPAIQYACRSGHVTPSKNEYTRTATKKFKRTAITPKGCEGAAEAHVYDSGGYQKSSPSAASSASALAIEWTMVQPTPRDARIATMHYTPNYLFSPWAPKKMAAALRLQSEALVRLVRFVVILREPVSRAVSSFWFKDGHTVEQAMATFERQMRERAQIDRCVRGAREWYRGQSAPNVTKLVRCADGISPGHFERMQLLQHIDKGIYADQLERWFAHFPRCSFYITSVERFYGGGTHTTSRLFTELLAWLGVAPLPYSTEELERLLSVRKNSGSNPRKRPLPDAYMAKLHHFFAPHNARLARMGADLLELVTGWGPTALPTTTSTHRNHTRTWKFIQLRE